MMRQLTKEGLGLSLEALGYKKQAVVDYNGYPSYEFKQSQLARVESVIAKVRVMQNTGPG
jgi:hypothetical protein